MPTTLPANEMSGNQAKTAWNVAQKISPNGRSTRQRPQHHGSAGQQQVSLAGLRHFLLDRVTAIHGAELKVYDRSVKAGGTFDALVDVDGELALVDWKTSSRKREEHMFEDYKCQAGAYRRLLRARTGINVPKAYIVVATRSGPPQVVEMDQYTLNEYEIEFELRCNAFKELAAVELECHESQG